MLIFRVAALEKLVDLRHRVLRAGMPRESAIFPGDELPTSLHVGMFDDDRAVCCATFHEQPWERQPAWQLRGMATDPAWQGRGLGRRLLRGAEAELLVREPDRLQLWCNARIGAVRFYQSMGWRIVSDLFEVPTAGSHFRMTKRLLLPLPGVPGEGAG